MNEDILDVTTKGVLPEGVKRLTRKVGTSPEFTGKIKYKAEELRSDIQNAIFDISPETTPFVAIEHEQEKRDLMVRHEWLTPSGKITVLK